MATQHQADITLAAHQDQLLQNNNVSYIAVVPVFDDAGNPTDEFVIEVGVYSLDAHFRARDNSTEMDASESEFVPERLPIPTEGNVRPEAEQYIDVVVEETPGFTTQSFTDRVRPAQGGSSVMNSRYFSAGTLGGVIRLRNDSNLYIISNWHVLTGPQGRNGDVILQPGRYDGGSFPGDIIANLYWSSLNNQMDAAIARVPNISNVAYGTRCFGMINGLSNAQVGARVKKCGRTTRATHGFVRSINATVNVSGFPSGTIAFVNQILTTHMSQPGDSGSLLLEDSTNRAVGLLFAGDGRTLTAHNHISRILGSRVNASKVSHSNGDEEDMPEIDFEGFGA